LILENKLLELYSMPNEEVSQHFNTSDIEIVETFNEKKSSSNSKSYKKSPDQKILKKSPVNEKSC